MAPSLRRELYIPEFIAVGVPLPASCLRTSCVLCWNRDCVRFGQQNLRMALVWALFYLLYLPYPPAPAPRPRAPRRPASRCPPSLHFSSLNMTYSKAYVVHTT